MQKVGIIGCGWLGFPLAKHLINIGFDVNGTRTTTERFPELQEAKINSFLFKMGESISNEFFQSLDILIICIPISAKHSDTDYLSFVTDLAHQIHENTKVIFTSSISVYTQNQLIANEENGILDEKSINLIMEKFLQTHLQNELVILRLGGLIGEDRHPIRFLAGKTNLENGNAPINLVHREDVIQVILEIIAQSKFNAIFNCVFPFHPWKNDYYPAKAKNLGLVPPTFNDNEFNHKIVDGQKVTSSLNFTYKFQP